MSSKLHGLVWEGCAHAGLILSRVAVMARLADYSNDEGLSWPAVETIQRQIGAKSKTTVSAAIDELERDGWLTKTERKSGGRNLSNVYQINVEKLEGAADTARKANKTKKQSTRTIPPIIDPSNINPPTVEGLTVDPSNIDPPIVEGSTIGKNTPVKGSMDDPDPSLKTDPSIKKTVGQSPEATDPLQADSLKIDYVQLLDIFHSTLPELPKVLKLTDKRRKAVRKLWKEYGLTLEEWGAYLRCISKKCRWMLEDRPDTSTGKTWRKKDFDYLVTEECYLKVKEDRANDLPKVTRADHSARDAAFISLVAQRRKPANRVEAIAKAAADSAGLGRMSEVAGRASWKGIWAQAVQQASEDDLARILE